MWASQRVHSRAAGSAGVQREEGRGNARKEESKKERM
jgi:hypothetical protein